MNITTKIWLLGLILSILAFHTAFAQLPGSLDSQFGTNGVAQAAFLTNPSECRAMALQTDGKVILGGQYLTGGQGYMGFARFNTNGTPDAGFGTGGKSSPFHDTTVNVAAIQVLSDGKILAAGTINGQPGILRMTAAGGADNTFGSGGVLKFDGSLSGIVDLKVLANGKMVGCGIADQGNGKLFAVFRLNANGTPDNTFDSDGFAYANIGAQPTLTRMAIQSDGKILLTGTVFSNTTKYDLALFRMNANGGPDNTFGANGLVTTYVSANTAYEQGNAVEVQWDGKIIVAGRITNGSVVSFYVVRYNTNGTPDNSFGTNGGITFSFNPTFDEAKAVAIQSDGKILVAGVTLNGANREFALARLTKNGVLDNTFGTGGKVTSVIGTKAWGEALALQSNGKIILGGYATVSNLSQFALARYNVGTVVGTQAADAGLHELRVFPNPAVAGTPVNLHLDLNRAQTCQFRLVGADGRLLQAYPAQFVAAGQQTLTLDLPAGLPAGRVILQVETGSGISATAIAIP